MSASLFFFWIFFGFFLKVLCLFWIGSWFFEDYKVVVGGSGSYRLVFGDFCWVLERLLVFLVLRE